MIRIKRRPIDPFKDAPVTPSNLFRIAVPNALPTSAAMSRSKRDIKLRKIYDPSNIFSPKPAKNPLARVSRKRAKIQNVAPNNEDPDTKMENDQVPIAQEAKQVRSTRPRPVQNVQIIPSPALQDFWKTLWHVDVQKDHGNDYDAAIINSFLPSNKYTTTLQIPGSNPVTYAGQTANREVNGKMVFALDLFKYLTNGTDYGDLCKEQIGYTDTIMLNPEIMGTGVSYDIKVFDAEGSGLSTFIEGGKNALYVDTASHLPELMDKFRAQSGGRSLSYMYTREIESDPADKMTFQSVGKTNKNSFYYEPGTPANPTTVPFNAYSPTDGLSYFYCKHPLFLKNNGPSDPPKMKEDKKKYKLDIELSYDKAGKQIIVSDGANTAGAMQKIKDGAKTILGINPETITKETVFISKHHGDVAQSLLKFRDIKLKNPATAEISSSAYDSIFVSIDVNAIIKALTVQIPYVIMYPPDKKLIIVWKNQNLNTPEIRFKSQLEYTTGQVAKLIEDCNKYNLKVADINAKSEHLLKIIGDFLNPVITPLNSFEEVVAAYKTLISMGIRLITLLKYIPKTHIILLPEVEFNFEDALKVIRDGDSDIEDKITALKALQDEINRKKLQFVIPVDYTAIEVLTPDDAPAETRFEKDVVFNFARARFPGKEYNFKIAGDRRVLDMWECITLGVPREEPVGIETMTTRLGTKLTTMWGIDLIQYVCKEMKAYDPKYITSYVTKIYNTIKSLPADTPNRDKIINTYIFGMSLVSGPEPDVPVLMGGVRSQAIGRALRRVLDNKIGKPAKSANKMNPKPNVLPTTPASTIYSASIEEEFSVFFTNELNGMEAHLELMMNIQQLYSFNNKLTKEHYKEIGYIIFDSFFKKAYDDYYMIDEKFREAWIEKKIVLKGREIGVDSYVSKLIDLCMRYPGTPLLPGVRFPENPIIDLKTLDLSDPAKFFTTYSVIPYYENVVNDQITVENRFEVYMKLRKLTGSYGMTRTEIVRQLEDKLKHIRELLAHITTSEQWGSNSQLEDKMNLDSNGNSDMNNNKFYNNGTRKKPREFIEFTGGYKQKRKLKRSIAKIETAFAKLKTITKSKTRTAKLKTSAKSKTRTAKLKTSAKSKTRTAKSKMHANKRKTLKHFK